MRRPRPARPRPFSRQAALKRIEQLAFQIREVSCCYLHDPLSMRRRKTWVCDCKYTFNEKDVRFPLAPTKHDLSGEFTGCGEAAEIAWLARRVLKAIRSHR